MKSSDIEHKLERLADMIAKIAAPVPAIPAIPAIRPLPQYTGDHDLLVQLDVKVSGIQSDVTGLKNDRNQYVTQPEHNELTKVVVDHEKRVRVLEQSMWKWIGVSSTIGAGISLAVAIAMKLITG